jgi:DNA helicase-2/ATP-dependent DNA helicase PcrA
VDFPLLIHLCIRLFEKYPTLAAQQRRVYRHIFVDEFQDTNNAQFRLLELIIANSRDGLLFLADQDQLVYQWNGASPWRLGEAQQRFSMEILLLPTSFRCPDVILKAANNLISHNSSRFVRPEFTSSANKNGSLEIFEFTSAAEENSWLVQQLRMIPEQDRQKTAVIARARKMLDVAMAVCEPAVPVVSPVARYEFESAPLVMLHNLFRLVVVPGAYTPVDALCTAFYQITGRALDANILRAEALAEESNTLDLFFEKIRPNATSEEFKGMDTSLRDDLIGKGRIRAFSRSFFSWAEKVADLAAARAKVAYKASYEVEKALWAQFETSNRNLTLRDFVQALDLESKAPVYNDRISFLTAHGAKGLEFDRVFVIGAAENHFPTFQAVKEGEGSDPMEEERRSFFVAITRCSALLSISYAVSYGGFRVLQSRFIEEMSTFRGYD